MGCRVECRSRTKIRSLGRESSARAPDVLSRGSEAPDEDSATDFSASKEAHSWLASHCYIVFYYRLV